jgi:hypothetical protein
LEVHVAMDALSADNIKRFAAAWYLALDIHAPTEACERLLVDEGLEMIFPEKTLVGISDFRAWYAGGEYSDGERAPGVINIFFDEIHTVKSVEVEVSGGEAVVEVVVGWQASMFEPPAAKSKRTAMDATQRWTVRPCSTDKNPYGLEITSYNAMAKPFQYAPGFATL